MIDWIKYQEAGEWKLFPIETILHMSRTHAINLFSGKIPVVAKEGEMYISNDSETRRLYHRSRLKITKFSELQPSDRILKSIGFLQPEGESNETS